MKTILTLLLLTTSLSCLAQHPRTVTNDYTIDTNAPITQPWRFFTFDTNYYAATVLNPHLLTNEWQTLAWVTNSLWIYRDALMVDTNQGPFEKRAELAEKNDFIRRALDGFRDGLGTNSYSTNFAEYPAWISTNRPR